MEQPIHYVISEQDFDLSLIPKAGRKVGTDAFRKYVSRYFRQQYEHLRGETFVEFKDGNIAVTWTPESADRDPMGAIIDLLNAGGYGQAVPMLKGLLQANPRDHDALYNLGMVYSDQGRLDDAMDLLHRAVEVNPEHANSWVALGVAALRVNDPSAARPALENAVNLDSTNPFALRTLATLHTMVEEDQQAISLLRSTIAVAPDDMIALVTLAQALLRQSTEDNAAEADTLLTHVLELAPRGEIAEKAKEARRKIAGQTFRGKVGGGLRHDAVMYCLDALRRFRGMNQAQLAPMLMEMATLGQNGLPVNDPEQTFTLRSLPGNYSALQIICMMHVGIKEIDPTTGSGFDIDREYEAALAMHPDKQ